jgi:hypothetical protein
MPDNYRIGLLDGLEAVFGPLRSFDSQDEGQSFAYKSIHFDYYNRMATRVCSIFYSTGIYLILL